MCPISSGQARSKPEWATPAPYHGVRSKLQGLAVAAASAYAAGARVARSELFFAIAEVAVSKPAAAVAGGGADHVAPKTRGKGMLPAVHPTFSPSGLTLRGLRVAMHWYAGG